ncbi:MAG: protein arginine kinase [Candidatus Omnitrophica bacterium]|nr:protein arginine kinase [Candidatus Omnitrophota bacterium]
MKPSVDKFLEKPAEWLRVSGPMSDVVISSRVRLARNFAGFPFLEKISNRQQKEIADLMAATIKAVPQFKHSEYIRYNEIAELDRQFLLERHLISREHAVEKGYQSVAVTDDEMISIMVLEEDHLRQQTFQPGFNLKQAWKILDQVDTEIEKHAEYAFSPSLGYLTACPTNVGTGLRASCMLHLPGLVLTKQIQKVLQALGKLNLAVRGLYGEGTQATGNFFQFSNQITLGQPEEEIMDNLESVIQQVVEHEKNARQFMREEKKVRFEDQIWRALGALKSSRMISSQESTGFLSLMMLGVELGFIEKSVSLQELNTLFLRIQPAHLQKSAGKVLDSTERDVARATLIRERLAKVIL